MTIVEAHFDESGTGKRELTLAGYLFESDRIAEFCDQWSSELSRYGLPYFHMVDCAHGSKPFDKLDKIDRTRLQMKLMQLVKRYAITGIVCNIPNMKDNSSQSYSEAAINAAGLAVDWANRTAYDGKIAYFFESGAEGQGLLDGHFREVANCPSKEGHYRYAGHAFIPKRDNPGVQAADLLAWQYHNFTKKRSEHGVSRLDLRALLRHPHIINDDCGQPPKEIGVGEFQDIVSSRTKTETVIYLPRATKKQRRFGTSIHTSGKDTWMLAMKHSNTVLCCPTCYRALILGMELRQIKRIVLKCPCGEHCWTPE